MIKQKLGFIGVGNMGGAIVRGLLHAGDISTKCIAACDKVEEKLDELSAESGIAISTRAEDVVKFADALILCVKPQGMEGVLEEIASHVRSDQLVISIAAGISTGYIESRMPEGMRVIRVMPNTPALVLAGAAAICKGKHARDADLVLTAEIFRVLGYVVTIDDEEQMDIVTALSGSGPAYCFLMVEALVDAAVKLGLPRAESECLAAQTLFGAGKMLLQDNTPPAELRRNVTSPGGTTEAALKVLQSRGFNDLLADALQVAAARAKELGQ